MCPTELVVKKSVTKEEPVKKIFCLLLSALLLLVCGCGSGVQKKTIDGVTHVINPAVEKEANISVTLERTIGKEMGDDNFMFSQLAGGLIDDQKRVYVLDPLNHRIQIYSWDGDYVNTIGRKGTGPGEFTMPVSMSLTSNGEISVCDVMARKLLFFDTDGNYLRDTDPTLFSPTPPMMGHWTDSSLVIGMFTIFEQDDEGMKMGSALRKVDVDSGGVHAEYHKHLTRFDPANFNPTDFGYSFAVNGQEQVFITKLDTEKYEIERFDPEGNLDLVIKKEYTPIPKTPAEIEEERELISSRMKMMGAPEDLANNIKTDPNKYAAASVNCDHRGRLWVLRGTEPIDAPPKFDIFTQEGELIGSVVIEDVSDDVSFFFFEDKIFGFDTNPEDYPKVYLLSISG
jgi:hypothetical protein